MPYTNQQLIDLLRALLDGRENEVVEFKEASRQFDRGRIGKYVSALSNEANLRGVTSGWLVFGINDKREPVGTRFLESSTDRQSLKHEIQNGMDLRVTIREIHEVHLEGARVLLLEIPAAPRGMPVAWRGTYYARAGESLTTLSLDKPDEIRNQTLHEDWSAGIVADATIDHLDVRAIERAREGFIDRHQHRIPPEIIESWDTSTFLARAKLTRNGAITRSALLLLGASESAHLLTPHPAELTWKLVGEQQAYEHFHPPFLLTATALTKRIRNVQLRLLPPDELVYREISKYDERSLLEAVYNCIAHQDYRGNARVIVTEHPDRVTFESMGSFFDGTPDDYTLHDRTPRQYRNPFLIEAMTQLNLVDHMGYGIHRMAQDQIRRFLPLPDYDLTNPGEVNLTIHGATIDTSYSQLLMTRTDLSLEDIFALDRVQKRLPISPQAVRHLRNAKLIEGRAPHLRVSEVIASATGNLADYVRTRPQTDAHYATLVRDLLQRGGASRSQIDNLLMPLLPETLSFDQKRNKISNLLTKLRMQGTIHNTGTRSAPHWELL